MVHHRKNLLLFVDIKKTTNGVEMPFKLCTFTPVSVDMSTTPASSSSVGVDAPLTSSEEEEEAYHSAEDAHENGEGVVISNCPGTVDHTPKKPSNCPNTINHTTNKPSNCHNAETERSELDKNSELNNRVEGLELMSDMDNCYVGDDQEGIATSCHKVELSEEQMKVRVHRGHS